MDLIGVTIYQAWTDVPETLKTKTGLKTSGRRKARQQTVRAYIDTRRNGGGLYALYDLQESLPALSPAEKQARAARLKTTLAACECSGCRRVSKTVKSNDLRLCDACLSDYHADLRRKADVRAQAQRLIDLHVIVIDTETTGLSVRGGAELVSIAAVQDGAVIFSSFVKPTFSIPPDATAIHGITDEIVRLAPPASLVVRKLMAVCGDAPVASYNAAFDSSFLAQHGFSAFDTCVMQMFARYFGEWSDYHNGWRWQSLGAACAYFDIDLTAAHDAAADALAAWRVLMAMADVPDRMDRGDADF